MSMLSGKSNEMRSNKSNESLCIFVYFFREMAKKQK